MRYGNGIVKIIPFQPFLRRYTMDREQREEIARFRFGVISDLVGAVRLEPGEAAGIIRQKSEQHYNIPHSDRTRISGPTIRRWIRQYEAGGRKLSTLYPANRADQGKSRRVDDETVAALTRLKKTKTDRARDQNLARNEGKVLDLARHHSLPVYCLPYLEGAWPYQRYCVGKDRSASFRGRVSQ